MSLPKPALSFPPSSRAHIDPYLPTADETLKRKKPFVTLTFAQSLDSKIALAPGTQTALSGSETKAMTHYLRSKHDAILVGVGTAIADNPALNCRLEGVGLEGQPIPVIVDPSARWAYADGEAECVRLAQKGKGKPPWIVTADVGPPEGASKLSLCGGRYVYVRRQPGDELDWCAILEELDTLGIKSVMIEGGARVINTLLQEKYLDLVDSVIITIAPVWLGEGGVTVTPPRVASTDGTPQATARLEDVKWQQYGNDIVMCGRMKRT